LSFVAESPMQLLLSARPCGGVRERERWQKIAEGGRRLAEGRSHDFYTL